MRITAMRQLGAGLGIVLIAAGLSSPGFRAAASGPTEALIRERQLELRQLKMRLEERRRKIADLRAEGQDLERVLSELERQRSLASQYLTTLETQVDAVETDLAARQVQLRRSESDLEVSRSELGSALLRYYKRGRVQAAELLVSSANFNEIFARSHYWIRAIRQLRGDILATMALTEEIRRQMERIASRHASLRDLKRERERQLRALELEEQSRRRDRAELDRQVALYEEQARKLLASQERIERMITEAQRAQAAGPGRGLAELKGKLTWPVSGRITTRFGTQIHPKYGTQVKHQGIEIAAAEGTPIKAVSPGRVVFQGWLEGYGNTVILDHGKGYFTLYGHASAITVAQGARVDEGQTVARVGSTDSLRGSTLHFEIRQGSLALDPVRWLRRRG
jgi:septal ring factor EnvC (AmiA/AmiB activator)